MKHLIWNAKPKHTILYLLQKGRCAICGEVMHQARGHTQHPYGWTVEHVTPQARGGGMKGNIVLTHSLCNHKKGGAMPLPYLKRIATDLEGACAFLNQPGTRISDRERAMIYGEEK